MVKIYKNKTATAPTLRNALELPLQEDEPDWETLKFLVNLDRDEGKKTMDAFASKAIGAGDKERVKKFIELGASPTQALLAAAYHNRKMAATTLEHGADLHQALLELVLDKESLDVEAGKFLIELGADANLALLTFVRSHKNYFLEEVVNGIRASKLIEEFGADPLLVAEFVDKDSQGYKYLAHKARVTTFSDMKQFINLQRINPSNAAKKINRRGMSVNLALLYLARNKDKVMAKHLIEQLDANPDTVAKIAQEGGETEVVRFLQSLTE